jgi:hypothetical protein
MPPSQTLRRPTRLADRYVAVFSGIRVLRQSSVAGRWPQVRLHLSSLAVVTLVPLSPWSRGDDAAFLGQDQPPGRLRLSRIAQRRLCLETLETRNSDQLDFHDVAVWAIRDALADACEARRRADSQS